VALWEAQSAIIGLSFNHRLENLAIFRPLQCEVWYQNFNTFNRLSQSAGNSSAI
jgi:hypothetical protein